MKPGSVHLRNLPASVSPNGESMWGGIPGDELRSQRHRYGYQSPELRNSPATPVKGFAGKHRYSPPSRAARVYLAKLPRS
jgi:hypothetical protein